VPCVKMRSRATEAVRNFVAFSPSFLLISRHLWTLNGPGNLDSKLSPAHSAAPSSSREKKVPLARRNTAWVRSLVTMTKHHATFLPGFSLPQKTRCVVSRVDGQFSPVPLVASCLLRPSSPYMRLFTTLDHNTASPDLRSGQHGLTPHLSRGLTKNHTGVLPLTRVPCTKSSRYQGTWGDPRSVT